MKASVRVSRRRRFGIGAIYVLLVLSPFLSLISVSIQPATATAASSSIPPVFQKGHWGFLDRTHLAFFDDSRTGTHPVLYTLTSDALVPNTNNFEYHYKNPGASAVGDVCQIDVVSDLTTSAFNAISNNPRTLVPNDTAIIPVTTSGLNGLTVNYKTYNGTISNQCISQSSYHASIDSSGNNLNNVANFNITFRWQDRNNITRVDAGEGGAPNFNFQFTSTLVNFDGKKEEVYIRSTELNASSCRDFMLIDDQRPKAGTVEQPYYETIDTDNNGAGANVHTQYPGDTSNCKLSNGENGFVHLGGWTQDMASTSPAASTLPTTDQSGGGTSCNIPHLGWLLCPVISVIQDAVTTIESFVKTMLVVQPLAVNGGNDPTYKAWNSFKLFANVAFILIFILIIFSTTLSIGIDNYTVKKALPRLVIAVIAVQFSFVLMAIAIDASNLLGNGVAGIFNGLSQHVCNTPATANVLNLGGTAVAWTSAIGLLILTFAAGFTVPVLLLALSAILSVMAVFVTLSIRLILIKILIFVAPLAIAAWVLPNTESYFKTWSRTFVRLLLMFPLIAILFSASAFVANQLSCPSGGGGSATVQGIVAAFIPIIAFFLVPMTFRWAGGAMTAISGIVTSRASGWGRAARQSQLAKDNAAQRRERSAIRANEAPSRTGRFLGRVGNAGIGGVIPTQAGRRRMASAYKGAVGVRSDETEAQLNSLGLGNDEMRAALVTLAAGGSSHGIEASSGAQRKAIEMLSQRREYGQLAQIREQFGGNNMDAAHARIWNDGIRSTIGDLSTNAGDLVAGTGFFDNINADQIASMHHSTAQRMMQYAVRRQQDARAQMEQAQTPMERQAAEREVAASDQITNGIFSSFQQVVESPQMRGRVRRETNQNIETFSGLFGAERAAQVDAWVDPTGNINPDATPGGAGGGPGGTGGGGNMPGNRR